MKTAARFILTLLIFSVTSTCLADGFPNENACYDPSIKTIQVFKEGVDLSPPVIQLNSGERLIIAFDDLKAEVRRFKYTIVHCGSDWQRSAELLVSDYIEGFTEENIDQFEYSINTTVNFIHFNATFPTQSMRPKISGNYVLFVYDDDPANLIFTARFMVVEPSPVIATGKIVQSERIDDHTTHQQIDFTVRLNGFQIRDVAREVKVVLQQNGRWDNTLAVSKPRFARENELDYRYDESISFNGGNQFRYFDIKSLIYQSERINKIGRDTAFQVFLLSDPPRTFRQYSFEKDINGRFYVKNDDHAQNSTLEADYVWVHFFLPWPAPITTGQFYIFGELTRWQMNKGSMMRFNAARKGYELNLLLKQGYYNYMYVLRENGKRNGDETFIEGNHWETENDYTIYVYFRETGSLYERLIAVNFLNNIL